MMPYRGVQTLHTVNADENWKTVPVLMQAYVVAKLNVPNRLGISDSQH